MPDITVDGTGLLCVTLLLRLRKEINDAKPGTIVHVVATDPAALLDLPAWCHMTGHHYLAPSPNRPGDRTTPYGSPLRPAPPGPTPPGTALIADTRRLPATT
ncbi:sulfurtransferase TusA family protein [Streptomyces cinereoruber]